LAQHLSCALEGSGEIPLSGVSAPERAGEQDLIYLDSPRHLDRVQRSAARCVVTTPELRVHGKTLLLAEHPKLVFAQAHTWLLPGRRVGGVHPTAIIAATAKMGAGTTVGPFAVIEEDVEVGDKTDVGAFCFLGSGTRIGSECLLHPRVTIYPGATVGRRVVVHAGAVLGSDGFGYVTDKGRHWKFPQVGLLEIGDDVEIGANTTLDRGSLGVTRLGAQAKLDNLVHVAHNVQVGERALIAAQAGIAGSSILEGDVVIGGQVGIADHCHLEGNCAVGAQAGIPTGKTIRRGQVVWGTPARPLDRFKEQYAWFGQLPALGKRLRTLETAIGRIMSKKGNA
jgi:UDP-3-O-[3-hydroxymyristoyl] glucosamine N-acyltransferase